MFDVATPYLLLAQDQPPPPGEAPMGGTTTAPGSPNGGPAPGGGAPSGGGSPIDPTFFYIMLLVLVGMIVFSMMGQRRERKRREAMISAIKKHDRVQTIGGVIGSVVEVKPDYIVLKVDESSNTRITFARSAIQQVLTASPDTSTAASTEQNR